MKGALIKAFTEVIKKLWSQDASDRVVNTASLKSQIQRFAPRFIGYAQQDAQEFLRYLLEGLHEDVNRVKEKPKPILTEIDEKLSLVNHSEITETYNEILVVGIVRNRENLGTATCGWIIQKLLIILWAN